MKKTSINLSQQDLNDLQKEYNLISEKKSNLSAKNRQKVLHLINHLFKTNQIHVEQ
jgi:hypothetical protein